MSDSNAGDPTKDSDPSLPSSGAGMVARAPDFQDYIPDRIGRYRILERLGGGGMGDVYVAEQTEPIKRRVAVKLIKAGMDTKQVVARFEAERQALAMMDHPNIARVIDAGATDTGRPYFVMELVRGIPITKFADDNKLTTRQRVELLIPICQAVQHAHQKGIIHRDIKPHNVLVTLHDGKPVPKVIDFGIAKATSQALTDKTIYTEFRQMIGTPAYMSPEQAEMSGLDIDTRSDIYSLGVLAYELLTGTPPFDSDRLVKAGLNEIQRIIREEDPPRPSIRFSTMGDQLTTIAKSRDVEPSKLSKLLAGELDWIVMRAMEKDRKRRYDTATDLAADFNRHLNGEPVVAAPPTWTYRTQKFVRKHKGAVITAAAVVAALTLGLAGMSWQAHQAEQQRARAEALSTQVIDDTGRATKTLDRIDRMDFGEDGAGGWNIAPKAVKDMSGRDMSAVEVLAFRAEEINKKMIARAKAAELEAYTADLALAQSAMTSGNYPEARARLDACPQSKRGWEWTFLRKQAGEAKYSSPCTILAFSGDGKQFLARTARGEIRLFSTATGKPSGKPLDRVPDEQINRAWSISNDGTTVAEGLDHLVDYGSDRQARVWNADTGEQLCILADGNISESPVVSPDGSCAATSAERNGHSTAEHCVELWELPNGTTPVKKLNHPRFVRSVVFSPDGGRIASVCDDNTVWIWDAKKGTSIGQVTKTAYQPGAVLFSPDGTQLLVLARSDQKADNAASLALYDGFSGKRLHQLIEHGEEILTASFNHDGSEVLVVNTHTFRLWNAASGGPVNEEIHFDHEYADTGCFTPDGKIAIEWDDDMGIGTSGVSLWSEDGAKLGGCEFESANSVQSPDGRFFFFHADNGPLRCESLNELESTIDFFGDRFDSANNLNVELEIEAAMADSIHSPTADPLPPKIPPKATVTDDGFLQISDGTYGREIKRIGWKDSTVSAYAFSPDGNRLVTSDDTTIRFYGTDGWQELAAFGQGTTVKHLQFTPDGTRLIVRFADGSAQIWDPRPLAERQKMWARRAAERKPAREYVERLLAGTSSPAKLKDVIRNDASITPLRKLVSLEILDLEISQRAREAKPAGTQPTSQPG